MPIRTEAPNDVTAIREVTASAFADAAHAAPSVDPSGEPGEATLVGWLRADAGWIPNLSLVALGEDGAVVGHVVCTRGWVGDRPALGLGPLSVRPDLQRKGLGSALMREILGAADALGEPLVALLGDPAFYGRFGFRPAREIGVAAPEANWGDFFQARTLSAYDPSLRGRFSYAAPFARL